MTLFLLGVLLAFVVAAVVVKDHPVVRELRALDRALVAKSWPALSPWWVATLVAFILSGCRQLVVRSGRRGGKSSSLTRFAVAFALAYDCTTIPPGDIGVVAFFSVRQSEAASRLRTVKAILDATGVKWKPVENGIELVGKPIAFLSYPATLAAALGFTSILIVCDEMAAWRDSSTGANPATEVLAAVRPTMASQRAARIILSSSAKGLLDAHAKAYAEGETRFQTTAFAETWVANPTLTEAELRAEEPNERVFDREYGAIPQAGPIQALNPAHFDACVVRDGASVRLLSRPTLITDLSMGGGDAATWWAVAWAHVEHAEKRTWTWNEAGDPVALPEELAPPALRLYAWRFGAIEGRFRDQMRAEDLVARIASDGLAVDARRVVGDQLASYFAEGAFRSHGLPYESIAWTNVRKVDAVATSRRWLRDRTIAIADGPHIEGMRAEVSAFAEKINANGSFRYEGANSHDDKVALILGAAMAEAEGLIDGSPHGRSGRRYTIHNNSEDQAAEDESYAAA